MEKVNRFLNLVLRRLLADLRWQARQNGPNRATRRGKKTGQRVVVGERKKGRGV